MLLALADNASDEGRCYPSIQYLAYKCNCTYKYATKLLRSLEKRGYVSRRKRYANHLKISDYWKVRAGEFSCIPFPDRKTAIASFEGDEDDNE